MFKNIRKSKIGTKLTLFFSLIVILYNFSLVNCFFKFKEYVSVSNLNTNTYEVLNYFDDLLNSMINMETAQRGFAITGLEQFLEPYNEGLNTFDTTYSSLKSLTSNNKKQQDNLDKIKELAEEWKEIADSSISLRHEVNNGSKSIDDIILLESKEDRKQYIERYISNLFTIGTLFDLILAIIITIIITKIITNGINKVTIAARKIAEGEINFELETNSKDEIGDLVDSFNIMKNTINNLINEVSILSENAIDGNLKVRGREDKFSGEFKTIVQGFNTTLDAMSTPIHEVISILSEMAKYNLQVDFDNNYKGDYKIIQDSLTNTLSSFNQILKEINYASIHVEEGANQIVVSNQELANGSTKQAQDILNISNLINNITSDIKKNANNSNAVHQITLDTVKYANEGNEQMAQLHNSMKLINESARAGEYGKGFAVVAEEIKKSTTLVTEITDSSNKQSINIDKINTTLSQISDVVQSTAAISEENAASSEELLDQSTNLKDMISQYKLK